MLAPLQPATPDSPAPPINGSPSNDGIVPSISSVVPLPSIGSNPFAINLAPLEAWLQNASLALVIEIGFVIAIVVLFYVMVSGNDPGQIVSDTTGSIQAGASKAVKTTTSAAELGLL